MMVRIQEAEHAQFVAELKQRIAELEIKRKEESMMVRIQEAEHAQFVAELKQRIAELEIQKEEILTADKIDVKISSQNDLESRIYDLQDEVLQLKFSQKPEPNNDYGLSMVNGLCSTGSHDDEEDSCDEDLVNQETLESSLSEILATSEQEENLSAQMQLNGAFLQDTPCENNKPSNEEVLKGITSHNSLLKRHSKGDHPNLSSIEERTKGSSSVDSSSGLTSNVNTSDPSANTNSPCGADDIIDVDIYKESRVYS